MALRLVAIGRIVGLASVLASSWAAAADTNGKETEPSPATPVAMIGTTPVTYEELTKAAFQPLGQQEAEYVAHKSDLEVEYERTRHATLDSELEKLVNKRVLDLEAQSAKTTPDALLGKLEKPTVTDAEARDFYETRKERTHESYEALEKRIKDHLLEEKTKKNNDAYYATLRKKFHADISLEPLRAKVSTSGPGRGPSAATVTIVEFADFQCPFCRQMEPVLAQALKRYPNTLRLVYKNYPLTEIHPDAMHAAEAAVCAGQQGKFWEMHDALFGPSAELTIPALRATAGRVGVESDKFEDCVRGHAADGTIQDDMLEGRALAFSGTPALFVNGRLIPGTISLENLSAMIDDELHRKKSSLASR